MQLLYFINIENWLWKVDVDASLAIKDVHVLPFTLPAPTPQYSLNPNRLEDKAIYTEYAEKCGSESF